MPLIIKDAAKKHLRARIGLLSPTGGGKTFTGLKFLFAFKSLGMATKVGVIDTEHGSASKYIGDFPVFRVVEMADDFSPEQYIEAINIMAQDGVDALMVDSLSHAWAGKGGSLELKDKLGRKPGFNDYTAWGPISSMQNRLIESLLSYPGHLIATMRLKMEHVIEKDPITGKNMVRKIGLQPVQRDGMEYELDLVGDLDQDHNFTVSKTRCSALDGYSVNKPGEEVVRKLKGWLESGEAASARPVHTPVSVADANSIRRAGEAAKATLDQMVDRVAGPATVKAAPEPTPEPAPEPAQLSPAAAMLAQIEAADTPAKLAAIATVVGTAHKARAISDDDRRRLLTAYLARERALRAQVAA